MKYIIWISVILSSFAYTTKAYAVRFLNYDTEEFFEGDAYDRNLWPTSSYVDEGFSRVVEYTFHYAIVEGSPWYEGCVRWLIPGMVYSNWEGKPEIPLDGFSFELPEGYKSVTFSPVEMEYKEFGFSLQPSLPPCAGDENQRFVDIEPYEGFFPVQPYTDNGVEIYRGTYRQYVGVRPVCYDYQHKIVRAYTHLKFRITYSQEEAGLENINIDNENGETEYFNLQGIKVASPQKGGIYIERKGTRTRKVVL